MEVSIRAPQAVTVDVSKGGISAAFDNIKIVQAKGDIEIVSNGEYNVAQFARAIVNVPIPSNYGRIEWNGITLEVS